MRFPQRRVLHARLVGRGGRRLGDVFALCLGARSFRASLRVENLGPGALARSGASAPHPTKGLDVLLVDRVRWFRGAFPRALELLRGEPFIVEIRGCALGLYTRPPTLDSSRVSAGLR